MTRITEYVGKEGVISSTWDHSRAAKPRPGDLLRWATGEIGRIEQVWKPEAVGHPEQVHVCYSLGSAFLGLIVPELTDSQKEHVTRCPDRMRDTVRRSIEMSNAKVYVSISGGPFALLPVDDLKVTYELQLSPMWNWGDNLAGADQGVQYGLYRPVFSIDRPKPSS